MDNLLCTRIIFDEENNRHKRNEEKKRSSSTSFKRYVGQGQVNLGKIGKVVKEASTDYFHKYQKQPYRNIWFLLSALKNYHICSY